MKPNGGASVSSTKSRRTDGEGGGGLTERAPLRRPYPEVTGGNWEALNTGVSLR
jgi:hypothetical protein